MLFGGIFFDSPRASNFYKTRSARALALADCLRKIRRPGSTKLVAGDPKGPQLPRLSEESKKMVAKLFKTRSAGGRGPQPIVLK